ncbi:helix-turn-helix transcriptional regulator [Ramlibacter algicola]|nr:helix-turn-helix transcriptional regulator [Ramlibacter algicola]
MEDTRQFAGAAGAGTDMRWMPAPGLDLVLDELAYGIAIAKADGEVVHANQVARHELASQRVLWVQQGRLQTHMVADGRVLADALVRAASGKRSLVTISAPKGTPLTLALVPVGRGNGAQPVQAGLLFARASVCESLMLCFFARTHSLTPAEETVLSILCQGYSAPQTARQLKVAVSTVRSHVRSLCAKTRSSGVRELVSRVAMLPPIAPAVFDSVH